ncbi:hypothetical protein ACFTWS_13740 [Streptomyces sp. NPDC057027]|uniref:hypothetical protein n=1 Tax=Streptomyces sp. NPDC057027 TaxID=3346004 RepID=UPI0036402CF2
MPARLPGAQPAQTALSPDDPREIGGHRLHGLFAAQVVDSGVDARTPWLATAYVPAPTLQQVVRRHGPLPVRTVLLLVGGIAEDSRRPMAWASYTGTSSRPTC